MVEEGSCLAPSARVFLLMYARNCSYNNTFWQGKESPLQVPCDVRAEPDSSDWTVVQCLASVFTCIGTRNEPQHQRQSTLPHDNNKHSRQSAKIMGAQAPRRKASLMVEGYSSVCANVKTIFFSHCTCKL
jgi:hypothetical protein